MPRNLNETHKRIAQVRQEILNAFAGLSIPAPSELIGPITGYLAKYYDEALTIASANEFREHLSGKHWSELNKEFLFGEAHWAAFHNLSPVAYRYYLPALLMVGLDDYALERDPSFLDDDQISTVLWALRPEWRDCYYYANQLFNSQASLFSPPQYKAVCSFLELIFDTGDYSEPFDAAQAIRWGWHQYEHPIQAKVKAYYDKLHQYEYPVVEDAAAASLIAQIRMAFADVPYPGDANICERPDYESAQFALEFRGLDWRTISPEFLQRQSTALHFFSSSALRYFLPAYLIADVMEYGDGTAEFILCEDFQHEPAVGDELETLLKKYDTEGLEVSEARKISMYLGKKRFADFSRGEREAIIAYLRYAAIKNEHEREEIEKALAHYWLDTI